MKTKRTYHKELSLLLGLATFSLAAVPLLAESQEADEKMDTQKMQRLTVTGDGAGNRKDLDPSSLSNPYRVQASAVVGTEIFTRQDIDDLLPKDLNDLLNKAVGINITYQGRKNPFFISQRGGGSFTYIVDGAVLPPSTNRMLYRIAMSSVEEVQVVRGATSLTLGPIISIGSSSSGSGLNTGFVIIRTKRPEKTEAILKGSIEQATGGHPVAHSESLFAGTDFTVSPSVGGYVGGLVANNDRPSQDTWFDGTEAEGGMGTVGLRIKKFAVNFMAYKDSGRFEMQRGVKPDGTLDNAKWYYDPLKTTLFSSDASMEWSPDQITLFNLFSTRFQQWEYNENFATTARSTSQYEEKTHGFGLRHNARFGGTLVQLGTQFSDSSGFGPNTSNSYNQFDTSVKGWGGSVEQTLLRGRLVLDAGYREDTKHIDSSATSAKNATANNDVDMAPARVWATGVHGLITSKIACDGRYLHGTQGLVGDFDMRAQTGTLHPEAQDRLELTLSASPVSYFRPALTWFNVNIKNKKSAGSTTYTTSTGTYYYYTEADELRNGLELSLSGNLGRSTTYRIGWTHMLKNETTNNGISSDSVGSSSPEDMFSVILSHKWGAYTANLSVKTISDWDSDVETGGLGGYTRVDVNVQRTFRIQTLLLNVALFARNVTNEHYTTMYKTGYYPDRGFTVGSEITLRY